MYRCEACGFAREEATADEAGPAIRAATGELATAVRTAAEPARRRDPATWSPLEYACHVRDVLLVQRERLLAARRTDRPEVEPMGRQERADHDAYAAQHPDDVARQASDAAVMFAHDLANLGPADWERTLVYNYPQPSERSLRWLAIHTLHEVTHHLGDIRSQLREDAP